MSIGTLQNIHLIEELGVMFQQVISYPPRPVAEACCGDFDEDRDEELRERLNETRRNGYRDLCDADDCE